MKRTKGISLIVLVVTIIVMIIIAGAIIISLSNTNVIDQAEYARERHNISVLEENLRLERKNILLEKHGTVKDEDVKVATILNLTEEDAINIATANSIPANMPAGTYYEIDGNRYATKTREAEREIALASRGIDRENKVLTDTYVVNDNLDVYYIISGTIGETEEEIPAINDEKVSQIIEEAMLGIKDEEVALDELKEELHLEDEGIQSITDIFYSFSEPQYRATREDICIYFYKINRIYNMQIQEIDEELSFKIEYVSKESNNFVYEYAEKIEEIRQELEKAFVGKTTTDMQAKYNDGTLEQYILEHCKNIKTIDFWSRWKEYRILGSITFAYGNNEEDDFGGYNTITFVIDENGTYTGITIGAGS